MSVPRGWLVRDERDLRVRASDGGWLEPALRPASAQTTKPDMRGRNGGQPLVLLHESIGAWRGAIAHVEGLWLHLHLNGARARLRLRPAVTPRPVGPRGAWWSSLTVSTLLGTEWLAGHRDKNLVALIHGGVVPGLQPTEKKNPPVRNLDTWITPHGEPRPIPKLKPRTGVKDEGGLRWALVGGALFPLDALLTLARSSADTWARDAPDGRERLVVMRGGTPVAAISACTSTAEEMLAEAEKLGEVPYLPDLMEET